jgi:GTPase SAR1 family protein
VGLRESLFYWSSTKFNPVIILYLIVIGCEYVGKTAFAERLMEWGSPRGFEFHLDDHFTIPDSSLSKEDRDTMLGLSPAFKERFQRFQAIYHVRLFTLYRDMLELGFYSEDTIYGPLYYGYEPGFLAASQGRELEKELPKNTILVLLTASQGAITERMEANPHEYQVIQKEDIHQLLEKFEAEFTASTIHSKISINTTDKSPDQVLEEFLRLVKPFLPTDDLIRMLMNP